MAGCLWAVGNTLSILAVRDVGLSIAFPLWNCNSLIGIFWGIVLCRELRRAPWSRKAAVVVGAIVISAGAIVLSLASGAQSSSTNPTRGLWLGHRRWRRLGIDVHSLSQGVCHEINPLTFLTYFTVGELGTMTAISVAFLGGVGPFWHELVINEHILFWPFLGGLMWVVGDLFQNYATKYVGISRGIPLSNTNQIWGL